MATCGSNPRLGIIGCGVAYTGELQHCVARCDWSQHPDGRAHITGTFGQIELLWRDGRLRHPDEADIRGLRLVDGRLRYPPPESSDYRGGMRETADQSSEA